jgi:hypothetical protein
VWRVRRVKRERSKSTSCVYIHSTYIIIYDCWSAACSECYIKFPKSYTIDRFSFSSLFCLCWNKRDAVIIIHSTCCASIEENLIQDIFKNGELYKRVLQGNTKSDRKLWDVPVIKRRTKNVR